MHVDTLKYRELLVKYELYAILFMLAEEGKDMSLKGSWVVFVPRLLFTLLKGETCPSPWLLLLHLWVMLSPLVFPRPRSPKAA